MSCQHLAPTHVMRVCTCASTLLRSALFVCCPCTQVESHSILQIRFASGVLQHHSHCALLGLCVCETVCENDCIYLRCLRTIVPQISIVYRFIEPSQQWCNVSRFHACEPKGALINYA